MGQFTLYQNRDAKTRKDFPYFLDVQHDSLSHLKSRVAIPLTDAARVSRAPAQLCPPVSLGGKELALLTYQMSTVPTSQLAHPCGDLHDMRYQIIAAIDFMVTGI